MPDTWWEGFRAGLSAGATGLSNTVITTGSFGMLDIDEAENAAFRSAGLSEEQQRASKIIGNISVNLLVAAAAPGALARLGGTRVGGTVLGSRPGQIIAKAITNRYTQDGLLTLNSGNALRHGYKTVDAILDGRNLDALENAVYTSENVFGVYNIGKGFAKPVRASVGVL